VVLFVDWEGWYVCHFPFWVVGGGTKTLLETDSVVVELSLTVPIVNTVAFLFKVIGEWWVEGKVISRGMSPVFLVVADGDTDSPRYHGWDGAVCWRDCPVRAQQEY
jgi:hypothetical protein